MKHRFRRTCYNADKLLTGCNTLKEFMKRVVKQSEEHPELWDPDTYKGDAFEALVEVFITKSSIDKRVNIREYVPHNNRKHGQDMGIDGYGVSHNGNLHTVQVKFRSNTQNDLTTKDMISNFVACTRTNPKYKDADMTLITTANGLNNHIAEQMYNKQVRTIGFEDLQKFLDKNTAFWDDFRSQMGV